MATEQRLIDANKLEKLVRNHRSTYLFKDDVLAVIAKQSTVDAVEVVHGEWIPSSQVPGAYRCNRCGKGAIIEHNFCNRCGAKMDGGAKE